MKIKFVKELNETSAKTKAKTLFYNPEKMSYIKTFAIFTAANPDVIKTDDVENRERNAQLIADIVDKRISMSDLENELGRARYQFYKVKGKFGNVEHSFLVYNIPLSDVVDFCRKYKQNSFIFGTNDNGKLTFDLYVKKRPNSSHYSYGLADRRTIFDIEDKNAQNMYTQISKDFKFSIPFTDFEYSGEDAVDEMLEVSRKKGFTDEGIYRILDNSLNENYTKKYRWECRTTLYIPRSN